MLPNFSIIEGKEKIKNMAAATYNIEIDQGSDYNITIEVKEDGSVKNLTTYSARAQARADIEDSSAAFSFTCTIPTPTNGKILMKLPAATSSSATAGEYVYDLEIYTSGDAVVSRLMGGTATISREVTR